MFYPRIKLEFIKMGQAENNGSQRFIDVLTSVKYLIVNSNECKINFKTKYTDLVYQNK